jgi:hypothetical protein
VCFAQHLKRKVHPTVIQHFRKWIVYEDNALHNTLFEAKSKGGGGELIIKQLTFLSIGFSELKFLEIGDLKCIRTAGLVAFPDLMRSVTSAEKGALTPPAN